MYVCMYVCMYFTLKWGVTDDGLYVNMSLCVYVFHIKMGCHGGLFVR